MANGIGISVDTKSNTKELKKAKDEAVARALEIIGLKAEGYSKALSPTDTGRLRNSITFATAKAQGTPNGDGGEPAEPGDYKLHGTPEPETVYLGTNVEYAPYQELGTRYMRAHPFIKPAIENHVDEYKDIFERELKDG